MEWLNAENVLGTAGVLVTLAVLAYERLIPGLKRIGYRVQMDTAIGGDVQNGEADVRLGLFEESPEMSEGSLVLLRIENDGLKAIGQNSYESDGLTVTFTDRTVTGVAVTEPNPEELVESLTAERGLRHEGNKIYIPRVPLNKGHHFKLLVMLTGPGVGRKVKLRGTINEGSIKRNRQQPRPSNLLLGVVVFLVVLVGVQQSLLWWNQSRDQPPIGCADGELTLTGSTALQPAMEEIGAAYESDCPGATIEVAAEGSREGLQLLDAEGRKAKDGAPPMVAMSDGRASGYEELKENPVGVAVFAMVVNDGVGVRDISLGDLRKLYRGEIRNWRELGGRDLPVRLVSRSSGSGTRSIFQESVLKGFESGVSSQDCVRQDDPAAKQLRCERSSTAQVLAAVGETAGAIGYGERQAASKAEGVTLLRLDGYAADSETVRAGTYPFRAAEYAYTYGSPPADSLASEFLGYLADGAAQNILRTHGHLSCAGLQSAQLC
ncbi:phosphate ABC transporter substrate-binding protein [Streptomyces armeniacus]|uniref:Phosphate ABC transporter substrate-binding protein n=1 Tax=Streptomyces armeniacus TaxID=83291 RepID=A0A345XPY1_9ACTN|nr:substrate-binding domain-containing protein [Streptomyces armeniacus]AXK33697.1 phosphate ABC transporter substrate-binding protein [Streptomyces armeniacus]